MTRCTAHAPIASMMLLALPAIAAAPAPDCKAPTTQSDLAACAYEDFLAANGTQAAALKAFQALLGNADRRRWRAAQTAWIGWRTAQCTFESGAAAGGSAREMLRWQCSTRYTRERTAAIERLANCHEGDLACPARKP